MEAFESFNMVIRDHSIHSNRHTPSYNIALGFVHSSCVYYLISDGIVLAHESEGLLGEGNASQDGLLVCLSYIVQEGPVWRQAGPDVLALVHMSGLCVNFMAR